MGSGHPLGVHSGPASGVGSTDARAGPLNIGSMQSVAAALDRLGELAASPTVARLGDAFASAGHELALVGGPVRDAFLGRSTNDLDFTTDATPDEILAIVKPIAEAHWDIGRAFGTIGAKIARRDRRDHHLPRRLLRRRLPQARRRVRHEPRGRPRPPRLHRERARPAAAAARARRSVGRRRGPARQDPAHAGGPRAVLRRRPAADAARRPVLGPARLRRRGGHARRHVRARTPRSTASRPSACATSCRSCC